MSWRTFIVRRLVFGLAGLLVLSMLVFLTLEVVPGDVARTILGPDATADQVAALGRELGLDRPMLERYGQWLGGALTGDFGQSPVLHVAVTPLVLDAAANSLVLALMASAIGVPLAVGLGFFAGMRRPPWIDPVLSRVSVLIGALPEFLIATLLILLFSSTLGILPATSVTPGTSPFASPSGLVLPTATLVLVMLAYLLRVTRASVVQVNAKEFVVAAELKGLPTATVVARHVAPNALLPTITVTAGYLSWMAGGLVVIEAIFAYPGLGQLMFDATRTRDVVVLEAAVLLVGAFRITANFAADAAYQLFDPRVRLA